MLKNISQLISCVIIVNQFGFSNNAIGAEATLSKDVWDAPIVDIIGPIEKGDLKKNQEGIIRADSFFTYVNSRTLTSIFSLPTVKFL